MMTYVLMTDILQTDDNFIPCPFNVPNTWHTWVVKFLVQFYNDEHDVKITDIIKDCW